MARPTTTTQLGPSTPITTTTLTLDHHNSPFPSSSSSSQQQTPQTLTLRLVRKKEKEKEKKKKVTWKEGTVDNEFLQRKSSKKCCIFHKEKPFDEDDSDDENVDCNDHSEKRHDHGCSDGCCSDVNGGD